MGPSFGKKKVPDVRRQGQGPGPATIGAQGTRKTDFVQADFIVFTFCPPLKVIKYLGEKFDYVRPGEEKNAPGADPESESFRNLPFLPFVCNTFSSVEGKAS